MSKIKETIMYVVAKYSHTSRDSGSTNENIFGGSGSRSFISMPMPRVINGMEKSTTAFLSDVIVRSHTAKLAF